MDGRARDARARPGHGRPGDPLPARALTDLPPVSVAVTDHAVERFLQRVGGILDPRPEIIKRVSHAWAAGRAEPDPGQRASMLVRDERRPDVVYVCRWDRPRAELLVITLWERGEAAQVPRRYTDELRRMDRRRGG